MFISENDKQHSVCFICNQTLANEFLKPWKWKRHSNTKHESYSNKQAEFSKHILRTPELEQKSFKSEFWVQEKYTKASFEASWLKAKKPFNIGEELVLPTAMTEIIHGKKEADKIQKIPLSNNTVLRQISAVRGDISEQFIQRIKAGSNFAIQLDKVTDITNNANLLCICEIYSH